MACRAMSRAFVMLYAWHTRWPRVSRTLGVLAFLSIGVCVTTLSPGESWGSEHQLSVVDGFYFSIVTISTVGYGDIAPTTPAARGFTVLYILIGCGAVFSLLSSLFVNLLERSRAAVLVAVDRVYVAAMTALDRPFDATDGPAGAQTPRSRRRDEGLVSGGRHRLPYVGKEVCGRARGITGRGVDLNGDGNIDFVEPPHPLIFWAQELLPVVLIWLLLQLASAGIFVAIVDGLDYGTAFYHCCTTAATVGYGDMRLESSAARAFASAHILLSVSWLAALFTQMERLGVVRDKMMERAVLLTRPLDTGRVVGLAHDGNGVDRLEFVVGMMQILGVELCGQPLRWDDVRPFILKFDELDTMHHGRIDKRVLERFAREEAAETERRVAKLGWSTRSLLAAHQHYETVMLEQVSSVGDAPASATQEAGRHSFCAQPLAHSPLRTAPCAQPLAHSPPAHSPVHATMSAPSPLPSPLRVVCRSPAADRTLASAVDRS